MVLSPSLVSGIQEMETLVVVSQHRNQYYSRGRSQISDGFISSPSRGFKAINCRTFQSGTGILSSPSAVLPAFNSPPVRKYSSFYSEPPKQNRSSNPIPINSKPTRNEPLFNDDLSCSERWAGPAYSNSPPPSSLPIPKFSLRQKRSMSLELPTSDSGISLELPISDSGIKVHPIAKSAPPSPTREVSSSPASDLLFSNASATQNLRRILHLDMADD